MAFGIFFISPGHDIIARICMCFVNKIIKKEANKIIKINLFIHLSAVIVVAFAAKHCNLNASYTFILLAKKKARFIYFIIMVLASQQNIIRFFATTSSPHSSLQKWKRMRESDKREK